LVNMMFFLVLVSGIALIFLWAERGFLKGSTRRAFGEYGWANIVNFFHMYFYARWTKWYIKMARILLPKYVAKGIEGIGDNYHGKVLPPKLAKKIVSVKESIPIKDLEQIIPYPTARKIVLDHPLDIVVLECPCRGSAENPCSPSMVCMVIGKPFNQFVLEHHPHKSKRITQQEAIDLLEEVHQKGCVHTAFFKEACLDRFYVICNCCQCCCLGIEAMVKHGVPIMAPSGFCAVVNGDLCINCGLCRNKCPFKAIGPLMEIDKDKCMGCGVCVTACPKGAIKLKKDQAKGIPLDVEEIMLGKNTC